MELNDCSCGHKPYLNEPCYADDTDTFVGCEFCGLQTETYTLGEHAEGIEHAVSDWNRGNTFYA